MHSFPELVLRRAQLEEDSVACRFFKGATLSSEELTFRSLWEQAAGLAQFLREQGLAHQRAVLICKSQKNFVIAFYACLLAGTVAVPAAPPRRQALQSRLRLVAQDARARAIIFDTDDLLQVELGSNGGDILKIDLRSCLDKDDLVALASRWTPGIADESTPAFLQYTSGSTGDPKGVVVSHGNLVRNCAAIQDAMAITPSSVLFTALPLFHDMGLVGGVLQLMYTGCSAGFLSPTEFVQYPERWLQIISRFGVTVSGGPNYMYDLAARVIKPEQVEGVDLSSWSVAFCGAEPIRASTFASFAERFAVQGFRAESFYPCYGMAEATLLITGTQVGVRPTVLWHDGAEVVGCGRPRGDTHIEIVDPETLVRQPQNVSGEIWVKGGGIAQGYWMRPGMTEEIFHARLVDDGGSYLRTGDLGFVAGDQLYVTGRLKDLIIINGKKYIPQDIELECERTHDALRPAGGASFDVLEGEDRRLVIVFELRHGWLRRNAEWADLTRSIRAAVFAGFALPVSDVVLIKPGTLPRTSSGKVQRSQCRANYLAGNLERVSERRARKSASFAMVGCISE